MLNSQKLQLKVSEYNSSTWKMMHYLCGSTKYSFYVPSYLPFRNSVPLNLNWWYSEPVFMACWGWFKSNMTIEQSIFACLKPEGSYGLWLMSSASTVESDYLSLRSSPCWMSSASLSLSIVSSWPQGVDLHVTHRPFNASCPPNLTVAQSGIFLSLTWYINRSPTPLWSCMWLPSSHSLAKANFL